MSVPKKAIVLFLVWFGCASNAMRELPAHTRPSVRVAPYARSVAAPIERPTQFSDWDELDWNAPYAEIVATLDAAGWLESEEVIGKGDMRPYLDVRNERGWDGVVYFRWKRENESVLVHNVLFTSPPLTVAAVEGVLAEARQRYGDDVLTGRIVRNHRATDRYVWLDDSHRVELTVSPARNGLFTLFLDFEPDRFAQEERVTQAYQRLDQCSARSRP